MTVLTADWLSSDETQTLFNLFASAGFQLFCVGGCVRNALLGEPVADIDMATDATPEQVIELARDAGLRSILTGIDHGTVSVIVGDVPFEITTFRTDLETDGRHATVRFSRSLEEDAQRRDFTMNALYVGADGTVHDTVGGLADLQDRRVRFIGNAADRIEEDHLRILRFFRFYAWYGSPECGIDADGLSACAEWADGIDALSRERVGSEMRKLLSAPDPSPAVGSMAQAGILRRVMPGADVAPLSVLIHLEDGLKPDWKRRALALGGESITDAWRLSKADARAVDAARMDLNEPKGVNEMAYRNGAEHAQNVSLALAASTQQPMAPEIEDRIAKAAVAVFPLKASDLMPDFEGPALGDKLKMLEDAWIASDFQLTREQLLSL